MFTFMMKRMSRNQFRVASTFTLVLISQGCGGSLFKVKPVVVAPMPATAKQTEAGGLTASAVPLLTDEENQELFETSLPLGGILPVRIELVNNTNAEINLGKAQIKMRNNDGEWKFLTVKQTVAQILKANEISLYTPDARKKFTKELGAYSLDTKTGLAVSERRQGLVFLRAPGKNPVESPRGLILTIEKLEKPIEIRLN
jgi:hypothetical protein